MVINIALFSFSANQITLSGLSPPFLGQSNYSDLSPFGVSQNFGTPSGANNIIYSFHFYAFDLSCAKDLLDITILRDICGSNSSEKPSEEAFVGETKKGCKWLQN